MIHDMNVIVPTDRGVECHRDSILVCGVDPGITNMSFWVGSYDPNTFKVRTLRLDKCIAGDVPSSSPNDNNNQTGKKQHSVQSLSADSAMAFADMCAERNVDVVVVETAPQWNMPIRLSAATIYGVFRGRGVRNVKFSSPSTKAKAINFFAERLGISDDLERPSDGVGDKLDKKVSSKIRLMNKRNAIRVVHRLLEYSDDAVGMESFSTNAKKQDDMADALMLGCGAAFDVQKARDAESKKKNARSKLRSRSTTSGE